MHPVGALLVEAAHGRFPPVDGGWRRVPPWRAGLSAVLAFTGHAVLALDDDVPESALATADGLGAAAHPRLVAALAGPDGWIDSLDVVLVAAPEPGPAHSLTRRDDLAAHPRVAHAARIRDDVEVWADDAGAFVTIGIGLGGLTELSVEVPERLRGRGAGRTLIAAARTLAADRRHPLVAAVAPGNAASLRAFLAAGFRPVAGVQLFTAGPYTILT